MDIIKFFVYILTSILKVIGFFPRILVLWMIKLDFNIKE